MQELGNEGGRNFVSENIWVAHWIVPFSSSGSFKMFLFSRVPLILLISWAQHPKLIFFLFFCWLTVLTSMMPLSFREQCWEAVKKPLLFKQFQISSLWGNFAPMTTLKVPSASLLPESCSISEPGLFPSLCRAGRDVGDHKEITQFFVCLFVFWTSYAFLTEQ